MLETTANLIFEEHALESQRFARAPFIVGFIVDYYRVAGPRGDAKRASAAGDKYAWCGFVYSGKYDQ